RVMFPITDARGGVIAFGGRGLTPDAKPKYLNSGDTPLFHKSRVLYRYKTAREALGHGEGGGLIVCEGYMDAIALAEAGFGHAVAPLGTALTEDQLQLIWKAGPEPVLCFDGDRAGLGAAYRAIDRALAFVEPGQSLFFVLLPDGMDPDDLIRARGPGAMADALAQKVALSELLWMRERDAEPLDTPERQAGLEARLMAAAGQIRHSGVRAAYERDLRGKMRDHFWQLRQAGRSGGNRSGDYRKRPGSGQVPASGDQGQVELKGGAPAKLRGLGAIVRAVDTPGLLDTGAETLAQAAFADPDVSLLRDALLDLAHAGIPIDRKGVCAHLAEAGNTRAASLLNEYPITPQIAVDGPEAREWLIALEQYMVAGRSAELEADAGMDDAGADATSSPSAWRRKHQLVAERRALKARMNEAAGKVGES
ncbi:MAG: toprim domain-containing protein, partial [Hyphomonas sp.]|nr:toprim domain-containing protein [Hyphomonas sp.]